MHSRSRLDVLHDAARNRWAPVASFAVLIVLNVVERRADISLAEPADRDH